MFSNLIELAGFAVVVDAVDRLAGRGWAVLAAGLFLLFIGAATDDTAVAGAVRRVAGLPSRGVRAVLRARKARRAAKAGLTVPEPSPHPPLVLEQDAPAHA